MLEGKYHHNNTILRQTLSVSDDNISYIAHAKAVHQNRTGLYLADDFGFLLADFEDVSGVENENIIFRDAERLGYSSLRPQMTHLPMNGDSIFWLYQ